MLKLLLSLLILLLIQNDVLSYSTNNVIRRISIAKTSTNIISNQIEQQVSAFVL